MPPLTSHSIRPAIAFALATLVLTTTVVVAPRAEASAVVVAADLDKLLAPVALYPDELLAQMLLCAANPGKVGALAEWLAANQSVTGSELQDAAAKSGFEPSFVALTLFPDVVNAMATDPAWTRQLGEAFQSDRAAVLDSVQRLRSQAQRAGNLKSTPQQQVETRTTAGGQQAIVIEPSNPQVVYVPQYDSQVVYTQPSTTVVVQQDDNTDEAVAGVIGFAAGVAIGAAIDNDYYYGPYGWHGGAYMYNDAWDDWEDAREDWYDNREDAREDWQDQRQDLAEERGDRARDAQEQRTERTETRQENRPDTQAQREQRRSEAQTAASGARASGASSAEARGFSGDRQRATTERQGTRSDAFSGYSSGKSQRAASSRGQRSRGGSRGGGRRR